MAQKWGAAQTQVIASPALAVLLFQQRSPSQCVLFSYKPSRS